MVLTACASACVALSPACAVNAIQGGTPETTIPAYVTVDGAKVTANFALALNDGGRFEVVVTQTETSSEVSARPTSWFNAEAVFMYQLGYAADDVIHIDSPNFEVRTGNSSW